MSVISVPNTFSANTTISSSEVNANFTTIYNEFNGSISSANLASDSVTTAKIADSNVTTAKIADSGVTPAKLLSGTGSTWVWQNWTPSYVNITVGNGTVVAKYCQIGKSVFVRVCLVFGTTTAVSGDLRMSLPVTSTTVPGTAVLPYLGGIRIFDTSTSAVYVGHVIWTSTTQCGFRPEAAGGTYTTQAVGSSTVPMTWATGDELHAQFFYEAA